MANKIVDKLLDKGFTPADIHFFFQRFDIGVWILNPFINKEAQIQQQKEKWGLAEIAADFEIPK